jgi:hypothetical protein
MRDLLTARKATSCSPVAANGKNQSFDSILPTRIFPDLLVRQFPPPLLEKLGLLHQQCASLFCQFVDFAVVGLQNFYHDRSLAEHVLAALRQTSQSIVTNITMRAFLEDGRLMD